MSGGSIRSLVLSLMNRNKGHETYYQTPSVVKFMEMELLTSENKPKKWYQIIKSRTRFKSESCKKVPTKKPVC